MSDELKASAAWQDVKPVMLGAAKVHYWADDVEQARAADAQQIANQVGIITDFSRQLVERDQQIAALRARERDLENSVCRLEFERDLARKERDALQAEQAQWQQHEKVLNRALGEYIEAGSIFQVGGELHDAANLRLGASCTVDGLKWIVGEYKRQKAQLTALQAELNEAQQALERLKP